MILYKQCTHVCARQITLGSISKAADFLQQLLGKSLARINKILAAKVLRRSLQSSRGWFSSVAESTERKEETHNRTGRGSARGTSELPKASLPLF